MSRSLVGVLHSLVMKSKGPTILASSLYRVLVDSSMYIVLDLRSEFGLRKPKCTSQKKGDLDSSVEPNLMSIKWLGRVPIL